MLNFFSEYANYLILVLVSLTGFNALIIFFFGRLIGSRGIKIIVYILYSFTFLTALIIFYMVTINNLIIEINLYTLFKINSLNIDIGFLFDTLTVSMCLIVFTISGLVHVYSLSYMEEDPHFNRFIFNLSLFTFFMVVVITSNNFIQLFFGWEGVGLTSYLLINFWYTRTQANKSALKAIIVNKIGDIGLFFGILAILYIYKTSNYLLIFQLTENLKSSQIIFNLPYISCNYGDFITWCLFLGILTKSAQLGFHIWLVDAMEGPTPVSALLHAATMVTIGIFFFIRCNSLFFHFPAILPIVLLMGSLTIIYAALMGSFQYDIKKIIAYSTCSQLGYMLVACGLTHYELALFHLFNHAFFKALLFLTAGAIIHLMNGKQDIRELGYIRYVNPYLYICFLIGSCSLIGLPYLSGYFSKDFIIETLYILYNSKGTSYLQYFYILTIVGVFFTTYYSVRLLYITFFYYTKINNKLYIKTLHVLSNNYYIPLTILTLLSILSGYLYRDLFIGLGTPMTLNTLTYTHDFYYNLRIINIENLTINQKFIPIYTILCAVSIAILFSFIHTKYHIIKFSKTFFLSTHTWIQKKLFFDQLYYFLILKPFFIFSYKNVYRLVDRGLFELIGPVGFTRVTNFFAIKFAKFYSINTLDNFIFFILLQIVIFCFIFILTIWNLCTTISLEEQIIISELIIGLIYIYKK